MDEEDLICRAQFVSRFYDRCVSRIRKIIKPCRTVAQYPEKLFGCSPQSLAVHLESYFPDCSSVDHKMAWKYYGDWHVDHIIPVSHFKSLDKIDQQIECFHYSNLQPLWASANLKKKRKNRDAGTSELAVGINKADLFPRSNQERDIYLMCAKCSKRQETMHFFACDCCLYYFCDDCLPPEAIINHSSMCGYGSPMLCSKDCLNFVKNLERRAVEPEFLFDQTDVFHKYDTLK